jgi:hypothetical protein
MKKREGTSKIVDRIKRAARLFVIVDPRRNIARYIFPDGFNIRVRGARTRNRVVA